MVKKHWRQRDIQLLAYYDNCKTSAADANEIMRKVGCDIRIGRGLVGRHVAQFRSRSIALLRIDVDWYSATMLCLDWLYSELHPMVQSSLMTTMRGRVAAVLLMSSLSSPVASFAGMVALFTISRAERC